MISSRQYLFGTTVLAGVIAIAAPAFAQTAPQNQTAAARAAQQQQDADQVDEIVVTGSRIRQTEYSAPSPVQIITSENSDLRGIPDAAQALLTSTLAVSSFQLNDHLSAFVTEGGPAPQSVSLRGLGPNGPWCC